MGAEIRDLDEVIRENSGGECSGMAKVSSCW